MGHILYVCTACTMGSTLPAGPHACEKENTGIHQRTVRQHPAVDGEAVRVNRFNHLPTCLRCLPCLVWGGCLVLTDKGSVRRSIRSGVSDWD